MACLGSSDIDTEELKLAASGDEATLSPGTAGCELIQNDSTGELKAARTAILKLLKESSSAINLLISSGQIEAQTVSDIAEQLLEILKHIREQLSRLQPETLHLIGEVVCLESTESITLMYKFHNAYFLSKYSALHIVAKCYIK